MPRRFDPPTLPQRQVDTERRLEVASELVSVLSTLTAAGQRFAMAKIVGVLRSPSLPHTPPADPPSQTVGRLMDDLTAQSARLMPDVDIFSRHAMDIVAVMRASSSVLSG
jgi:hypothetical protein